MKLYFSTEWEKSLVCERLSAIAARQKLKLFTLFSPLKEKLKIRIIYRGKREKRHVRKKRAYSTSSIVGTNSISE